MASEFTVPVVDISPYVRRDDFTDEDRARVAADVDTACRTVGFLQVLGHGVPPEAVDGLAAAIDEFFALPLQTKKGYVAPAGINRGYTAPKSEQLSLSLGVESASRMNDFFEAFNIGADTAAYPDTDPALLPEADYSPNLWPTEADRFRALTERWFAEAGRVARTLTVVFADALGMPERYFGTFTDHSLDVLRMNNYALPPGEPTIAREDTRPPSAEARSAEEATTVDGEITVDGDLIGMGEHTDYGIVTVLWADQAPGLQVLADDGSWHDVSPLPGALLVNLGDLTNRWTNERWKSTLHRVKPPIVDGTIRRRRSAAYFHDGNIDAVIETLPSCVDDEHPQIYPPITVGEHIRAKLAGSRAGKLNDAGTEREAARVRAAVTS